MSMKSREILAIKVMEIDHQQHFESNFITLLEKPKHTGDLLKRAR